jgi:hypothetical protein
MTDRVRSIKWESPEHGGTQTDQTPTEIDVGEDFLDCRGVTIQDDTSDDEVVRISRDVSGNLDFTDPVYGATITLSELATAGATSIIEARGILTRDGGIVYNKIVGGIELVVRPA